MKRINKNRFKENGKTFDVSATFYDEPEFNVRILIPTELKDLWLNKKVFYNVNMPYDNSIGPEFFVDNEALFIDVDTAVKSHKFMDEDEKLIDENYGKLPDRIYATHEGKFDDEFTFISCDDEYFDSPSEFSEGTWRLDWYGCDQNDFDFSYMDYFGEYPEDSGMDDYGSGEEWDDEEDEDEEYEDEEYEESSKKRKNPKMKENKKIYTERYIEAYKKTRSNKKLKNDYDNLPKLKENTDIKKEKEIRNNIEKIKMEENHKNKRSDFGMRTAAARKFSEKVKNRKQLREDVKKLMSL